ncbi:putative F-box protein [Arabidopsis thaliana]
MLLDPTKTKNPAIIATKYLSHGIYGGQEFEIYEINSNSWRILDVTVDSSLYIENVSLKGKTYWFATDGNDKPCDLFLICFDYTTERFERLCLPYQIPYFRNTSLSVVKEEKLSVLLQPSLTSKTQIWVTNKIGEAKVLSWIKFLTVDLKPEIKYGIKFLVDEENKVLVYEQNFVINGKNNMIYVVGEDNEVREVVFRVGLKPLFFYYVPSLTQIQQGND